MKDKIQQQVSKVFNLTEKRWIFLSVFDTWGKLVFSKWMLFTDKMLKDSINDLVSKVTNKSINFVVCDVVKNVIEVQDVEEIKKIDVVNWWICIVWDDGQWLLLPNTKWIPDSKTAISLIVKKNKIRSKKVNVYKFSTQRFTIKI